MAGEGTGTIPAEAAPAERPDGATGPEAAATTAGTAAVPGEGAANASASQPDWGTIEKDLQAEADASKTAETDPGAASGSCAGAPSASLGVLVATSDTNEFVGNANVELTLDSGGETEKQAGGGQGAAAGNRNAAPNAGGGTSNSGVGGGASEDGATVGTAAPVSNSGTATVGANGGSAPEEAPPRKPPDKTALTGAQNGAAIWKPISPAGEYFINIPVLPEDYRDKYRPPPFDEYKVAVADGRTATKIVFIHPKPWIEIKLLDTNGEPAKGHAYRLELPVQHDAEAGALPVVLKEGKLDDGGFARVTEDDVNPGTELAECNVVFPTQGSEALAVAVLDSPDWVKIALLDTLGLPARFWRYEVFTPGNANGEPNYAGTLDAVGSALVMLDGDIEEYEISFLPPLPHVDELASVPSTGNWVKIEAVDGIGEPAARWRYEIAMVGKASRYSGTLDTTGQALVPIFVGEECEITFSPPSGS